MSTSHKRSQTTSGRQAAWIPLVVLWESDASGWFAYDGDHLVYTNPALTRITGRRPKVGDSGFVLDVAPGARAGVSRAYRDLRYGLRPTVSALVPAMVGDEPIPVRLVMTRLETNGSTSVVGSVTPLEPGHTAPATASASDVQRAVGRIMAEVSAVLPDATGLDEAHGLGVLSDRQNEVLRLIRAGLGTSAIAARLHLSVHTVRNHIQHILRRLGLHSQAELIAMGRDRGVSVPHAPAGPGRALPGEDVAAAK